VVEKSISESSQEPLQQGISNTGSQTAYEISRIEQNANTILGLFVQMIAKHVKDFGKLRLGDIIQHLTLPEVKTINGNEQLVYKTLFLKAKGNDTKNKKIEFLADMPDMKTEEDKLNYSYDVLEEEKKKDMRIAKVNPTLYRELQYMVTISPDVLTPRSEDLERAMNLETYDRLIGNPKADQEEALKLLLESSRSTRKDPERFIMKEQAMPNVSGAMPQAGNSPLNAMMGGSPISKTEPSPLAGMQQ
jgi:hypothetical protein